MARFDGGVVSSTHLEHVFQVVNLASGMAKSSSQTVFLETSNTVQNSIPTHSPKTNARKPVQTLMERTATSSRAGWHTPPANPNRDPPSAVPSRNA